MPIDPSPVPSPIPSPTIRCEKCGRSDSPSHADLLKYTRQGWPKCCDGTMSYFSGENKVVPEADTMPEVPALKADTIPEGPALPPD